MPNCPNCHTLASPDARFCASCGTRLRDDGDDDMTAPVMTRPRPAPVEGDDPTDPNMQVADPTLPLGPELVTCPRCSAPNVPKRRRCGRCGADLHRGDAPAPATPTPDPAPRPAADPDPLQTADLTPPAGATQTRQPREGRASTVNPPVRTSPRFEDIVSEDSTEFEEPDTSHRRRWRLTAVVAVGVGLGALLGVLMVAGLGPFGEDPSPTFVLDEARYDEVALPLTPTSVGASSVLPGDAVTSYGPSMFVDGDRRSAWRSLPEIDEPLILDLTFDEPVWVLEVAVATGDQSSADAFEAAGRPTELLVTFDGTRPVRVALQDVPGVQSVLLDLPRLTAEVRLEIAPDAIVGGTGAAISEITVSGFEADDADARAWRNAYG